MRKFFKTYRPFASNELKRQMAYKGSFYLFILCDVLGSFIAYYLWMAIYSSAQGSTLGGLTRDEMMVYVFMSFITSTCVCIGIAKNIGMQVQDGSVAMNLIKPIDYRTSLIAQSFGDMVYYFLFPSVFIWIGVEIYKAAVLGLGVTPFPQMLMYVLSMILSFLVYSLFDFCFGLISFCTTYLFGMLIIRNAVISFLTGQLIPLSFFPEVVQKIFDFMPFSSMVYVPVMIYLGKYTGTELALVMLRQLLWVGILFGLGSLLWKRITKRLVVLGG